LTVEAPSSGASFAPSRVGLSVSNRIGIWLAILAFLHGMLYLALTPPWQAPDEPQHFQYVRFLLDERRLPTRQDAAVDTSLVEQVKQSMTRFDFWALRKHDTAPPSLEYRVSWGHPPLYYGLAAATLAPFLSLDVTSQLYIVRLLSVTLTALTVWVAYQATCSLFPASPALTVAVPLFIALLPMHAFIGSSVNNDTLAELAGTVVIWLLILAVRDGLSWRLVAGLFIALAAALLSKRTAAFLVPSAALTLLALLPSSRRQWMLVVAVLAVPAWLLLLRQSPGSYIGALLRGLPETSSQFLKTFDYSNWLLRGVGFFTTFWGNFGWMVILLDRVWYVLLFLVTLGAGAGWIKLGRNWRCSLHTLERWQRWALAVCALAILLVLVQTLGLSLVYGTYQQARYLYPAIWPVALFLILGWGAWVPPSWHYRVVILGAASMVALDLTALILYQLPFYYG